MDGKWPRGEVDYYSATVDGGPETVIKRLAWHLREGLYHYEACRPLNYRFYQQAVKFWQRKEHPIVVEWGGPAAEGRVHLLGKGGGAGAEVARFLRKAYAGLHQVARADWCYDYDYEGAFEWAIGVADGVAEDFSLYVIDQGDWSPHKGLGRTRYYCLRKNNREDWTLVIYEKGKQKKASEHWTRVELRAQPQKPKDKRRLAELEVEQVWALREWTAAVFRAMAGRPELPPGVVDYRERGDRERAVYRLRSQYGKTWEGACADVGVEGMLGFMAGALELELVGDTLRVGGRVAPLARPDGQVVAWGFGVENPTTGEIDESEFVLEDHRVFQCGVASKGEDGAPAGGLLVGDDTADESGSGVG